MFFIRYVYVFFQTVKNQTHEQVMVAQYMKVNVFWTTELHSAWQGKPCTIKINFHATQRDRDGERHAESRGQMGTGRGMQKAVDRRGQGEACRKHCQTFFEQSCFIFPFYLKCPGLIIVIIVDIGDINSGIFYGYANPCHALLITSCMYININL